MLKLIVLLGLLDLTLGAPKFKTHTPMLDGRIIGGDSTDIVHFPFSVSLQRFENHICGAALISTTWVLTAAHCVVNTTSLSIRAGSTNRNSGGVVINVKTVIIHSNYSTITVDYDIAAILLVSPVNAPNAIPIALALEGGAPIPGSIATITGWGALSQNGTSTNILQVVQVPVVSQADCRAAYTESDITDRMFCTGLLGVGGKDACHGDSGGPVVVGSRLTGLVSWGTGCARPNFPGVKTSVGPLRSWIRANTGI